MHLHLSGSDTAVEPYLEDASGYRGQGERTFIPADTEELRSIVLAAVDAKMPLTVSGAGTGLTGGRVPQGGWVVSLRRFNNLTIGNGVAHAGAGVVLQDLQQAAAQTRQFFGPNPTESLASIGGIINTNASGSQSFLYGSVRKHVLALEATFLDGTTRQFRRGDRVDFPFRPVHQSQATKNSAGYPLHSGLEWIDLLSGSEGTLAIITDAELSLFPDPPVLLSAVIFFGHDADALNAVDAWRGFPGLRILEYFDGNSLDMIRPRYQHIPSDAAAGLIIEQELTGEDDPEVDRWLVRLEEQNAFQDESWFGFTLADRERFREFRHALPIADIERSRQNGYRKYGTDFAVPPQHGRELISYYRQRCDAEMPGRYVLFGHIGDANCHLNLFPSNENEVALCERLMDDFALFSVSLGGTVAAEHGIGKIKTGLLRLMYTPDEIAAMLEVKRRLDPLGLLGRGTIFGDQAMPPLPQDGR